MFFLLLLVVNEGKNHAPAFATVSLWMNHCESASVRILMSIVPVVAKK